MKRFLALTLALCFLGSMSAVSYNEEEPPASEDDAPLYGEVFTLGQASESGDIQIIDAGASAGSRSRMLLTLDGASDLPSSYDPREAGVLPTVRSQGAWNTCWAMAAIGAAEISAIRLGSASVSGIDLSERHLAYFLSHQADDPLGNSSGDYNTNPSLWISSSGGGNPILAAMTLAGWHGAASEAATNSAYGGLKLNDSLSGAYAYTDILHLQNTYVINIADAAGRNTLKQMLLDCGSAVLCMYYNSSYLFSGSPTEASKPTPSPTNSPTPTPEITVIPTTTPTSSLMPESETTDAPAETVGPGNETEHPEISAMEESEKSAESPETEGSPIPVGDTLPTDTESENSFEGLDDAYGLLLDGDAVESEPFPGDPILDEPGSVEDDHTETEAYSADDYTVCYYQNTVSDKTNHEVVIVGWNDDYPKENFGWSDAGAIPPEDGAWLCRNSYGDSWAGGDGYFWASYYDSCISADVSTISGRATVFDFADADDFDNNYEYDGAAILGYVNDYLNGFFTYQESAASPGWRRHYANVFTASANGSYGGYELLRAVSTYTYRANVPYSVKIYTDLTDLSIPTSGKLAASFSGIFPYAGLHTVRLPSAVRLEEGDVFSVVFSVSRGSDNSIMIPSCYTNSSWYSTNETLPGQSFVSGDGANWTDGVDLRYVYRDSDGKLHASARAQNVRIKAYTDSVDMVIPSVLTGDADKSGEVTPLDAAMILRCSVGLLQEVPGHDEADMNEDGAITASDGAAVLALLE